MPQLGGFFAVSYVAEKVFTEALENAWKVRWLDGRGPISFAVPTPFGQAVASGAFSLDKPALALVGAANVVRLSLSIALRLDVQLEGFPVGSVFIEAAAARIDVPVVVTHAQAAPQAVRKTTIDLSQFVLTPGQVRLTWFQGPLDSRANDAILSDAMLARLTDELRRLARPYLEFSLPSDLDFAAEVATITAGNPGSEIRTPVPRLSGVRVLDGWLAIGVDDAGMAATHGDLGAIGAPPPLVPGARNTEAILVVDGAIIQQYLTANAGFALAVGTAGHPDVHPSGLPTLRLLSGAIEITTEGQVDAPDPFSGTVPLHATYTVKPFLSTSRFVYASVSPNVRVDAPWYMQVLGAIKDLFGGDSYAKLHRANEGSLATLFRSAAGIDVPGMPGMRAGISIEVMLLEPDFLTFYFDAFTSSDAAPPPEKLQLDFSPWSVEIRGQFLQLGFTQTFAPLLLADPTYRLSYEIRRGSNDTLVAQGTAWSGTPTFGEAVDLWDPENYLETSFSAEVAVERPPGNVLARSQHKIGVSDLFDRAHPFARWRREHLWLDKHANPPVTRSLTRKSAVHKTAIRERCKFADEGRLTGPEKYTIQALDTLPAPEDPNFSGKLCPYCFRNP